MKKLIAATLSIAAIALPQVAIAQTARSRGIDTVVTFEGAPNSPFAASIWAPKTRIFTANACGLVIVPTTTHTDQFIHVIGQLSVDYLNLPVQTLPTCRNGVLSEARPTDFKLADGKTVLVEKAVGAKISVESLIKSTRGGTFNACGIKSITFKGSTAFDSRIEFNGQMQRVRFLTFVEFPPICKKVGENFVKYRILQ